MPPDVDRLSGLSALADAAVNREREPVASVEQAAEVLCGLTWTGHGNSSSYCPTRDRERRSQAGVSVPGRDKIINCSSSRSLTDSDSTMNENGGKDVKEERNKSPTAGTADSHGAYHIFSYQGSTRKEDDELAHLPQNSVADRINRVRHRLDVIEGYAPESSRRRTLGRQTWEQRLQASTKRVQCESSFDPDATESEEEEEEDEKTKGKGKAVIPPSITKSQTGPEGNGRETGEGTKKAKTKAQTKPQDQSKKKESDTLVTAPIDKAEGPSHPQQNTTPAEVTPQPLPEYSPCKLQKSREKKYPKIPYHDETTKDQVRYLRAIQASPQSKKIKDNVAIQKAEGIKEMNDTVKESSEVGPSGFFHGCGDPNHRETAARNVEHDIEKEAVAALKGYMLDQRNQRRKQQNKKLKRDERLNKYLGLAPELAARSTTSVRSKPHKKSENIIPSIETVDPTSLALSSSRKNKNTNKNKKEEEGEGEGEEEEEESGSPQTVLSTTPVATAPREPPPRDTRKRTAAVAAALEDTKTRNQLSPPVQRKSSIKLTVREEANPEHENHAQYKSEREAKRARFNLEPEEVVAPSSASNPILGRTRRRSGKNGMGGVLLTGGEGLDGSYWDGGASLGNGGLDRS